MKIFKRLQRHIDTALADPAPAPYTPRTTVQSDGTLPRRFKADRPLDRAAYRTLLGAVYFDKDSK